MKNRIFAAAAVIFILMACENGFSPRPLMPRGSVTNNDRSIQPENFTASHGKKRIIELNWDEVPGAVRYNISMADNPFVPFIQCAETTETQFSFTVPPGKVMYYRVSSVTRDGEESAQSPYVMGSSLAQPLITDITDVTESSSTVTWYMDNVSDKTYRASLRYTVYCMVKGEGTEVAQLALDGSQLAENKASFTGLFAGKEYTYQVEAYLVNDQSNSEKSEIMDRETARRFRPAAPEKLTASHGTAKDKIELSFELPEMVNIALNADEYELHGLYFVIFRKSGNTEYLKACSYFGSAEEKGPNSAGVSLKSTFAGYYDFGKTVTWTDTNVVRGVEYQYLVQSYVDGTPKVISSDASKAEAAGWALAQGTVSLGKPVYTPNIDNTLYAGAELPLNFTFDSKGEEYRYKVLETINPIEDKEDFDPDETIRRESLYLTGEQMRNYRATMNLAQKSTAASPGRGLYSYQVIICLSDSDNTPVDTLTAVGDVQIIEDMHPIVVDGFWVQDGYTDKFRVRWNFYPSRKYVLLASADGSAWTEVTVYNTDPSPDESAVSSVRTEIVTVSELGSCYTPDNPVYFAMQPIKRVTIGFESADKKGQRVYSEACRTLGQPKELSVDGHSYSTLTAAWDEAQKADTYRIKYKYESGSWKTAGTVNRDALSLDAYNQLKYSFKPEGYNIIANAGKGIQVKVEALNKALQADVLGETGSDEGEIITSSTVQESRLVGPANLAPQASKAASAENIEVSWNAIAGADGYYVFRRQFNMDNTAEKGVQSVVYYVPAQELSAIPITGKNMQNKNGVIDDTTTVAAEASYAASRYTLIDKYMKDAEYTGAYGGHIKAYRDQQNELSWGYSYRYYIVPVVNRNGIPESPDSIEFTYDRDFNNARTGIASFSIKENGVAVNYTGAITDLEKTGFTIGFGQNVTATKGTYTSTPSGNLNDGIKITWSPPPLLASVSGFSPRYTLYRRYSISDGIWSSWTTAVDNIHDPQHTDVLDRGVIYEYVVGITNGGQAGGSDPRSIPRFIDECYNNQLDEKGRPKMIGFMLNMVRLVSVSRDQRADGQGSFGEEVRWSRDDFSVDGYTVYLLNRNINNNRQWIECDTVPGSTLSLLVTNTGNRLKVLREYRHYYKIRSYVLNDTDNKIYCPDPMANYTWTTDPEPYVKWGARQVSADEFAAITALSIGTGMNWAGSLTSDVPDRRGDHNVSFSEGNIGYDRDINFNNSKPYFVTVNGHLYGFCSATQNTPTEYGADCNGIFGLASGAKNHESTLTITGPGSEVSNMYSGTVKILRLGSGAGTGPYKVSYNGQNDVGVEAKHYRECFTFQAATKNYKRTRNFDWSPSTGIAGTGSIGPNMADKWWYPVSGTGSDRAGWD